MDPAVERYVRICAAVLWGPQGRPVRDWLHGRGFDEATIAPTCSAATPAASCCAANAASPTARCPRRRSRRSARPARSRFVQARYLDVDTAGRKYDNPAAALAPTRASRSPRPPTPPRWPWLVVCEGMPDALTAAQAGYRAVGLLGAQAPDESVAARVASYAERHTSTSC